MNYLQPICPGIVYSSFSRDESIRILNTINTNIIPTNRLNIKNILDTIIDNLSNGRISKVGIIGMEFADNYSLLYNLKKSPNFDIYHHMTLFILLKLAIETGYTHSDFHPGNIFINENDDTYFKSDTGIPILGRPLLIDYGMAQKIPIDKLNQIKTNCENKNYTDALKILCTINRPDGEVINNFPTFYGYVCGTYKYLNSSSGLAMTDFEQDTNKKIITLFKNRENAINILKDEYKIKHESEPDKYPWIPLSNSIKNKMYSGLI
jgi:serine/threonine protein kinase